MSLPVILLTYLSAVECRTACTTRIQFSQLEEPRAALVLLAERIVRIRTLHQACQKNHFALHYDERTRGLEHTIVLSLSPCKRVFLASGN